jgi:hypothetical protein
MELELDICEERHYTIPQIAEKWNRDPKTIRGWFRNEPGVLISGSDETRYGRKRIHISVPRSVMMRVHRKHWPNAIQPLT